MGAARCQLPRGPSSWSHMGNMTHVKCLPGQMGTLDSPGLPGTSVPTPQVTVGREHEEPQPQRPPRASRPQAFPRTTASGLPCRCCLARQGRGALQDAEGGTDSSLCRNGLWGLRFTFSVFKFVV